jgi:hypothetical protein
MFVIRKPRMPSVQWLVGFIVLPMVFKAPPKQ